MGCGSSKPAEPAPAAQGSAAQKKEDAAAPQEALFKIYGVAGSMNCMGPILLAKASGKGDLEPCVPFQDTATEAFLKMNPFHAVPVLKEGDFTLAETSAILRYIAGKHAPEAYPKEDGKRRAFIDWAMDRFNSTMYADAVQTIYPVLGYAAAPEDQAAAAQKCNERLEEFARVFLSTGKFIGGSTLSAADYRVAPYFVAYAHPAVNKVGVNLPDRLRRYNEDFMAACPASGLLTSAGGFAIKEMLDAKAGAPADFLKPASDVSYGGGDALKEKKTAGKVKIHGVPVSMNCAGALMLAKQTGCGEMALCVPFQDTVKEEFAAMNPFKAVPALQDGDFCLAESSSILRYMATAYAPDLYPADEKVRGKIDWAMDRFGATNYSDAVATIYPAMGFAPAPADLSAAAETASKNLLEYSEAFLKDSKFIGGSAPTIADYKVVPFLFAWGHPHVEAKSTVKLPDRLRKYVDDFQAEVPGASVLLSADGSSLKEYLDGKKAESAEEAAVAAVEREEAALEQDTIKQLPEPVIQETAAPPLCGCWAPSQ